MTRRVIFRPQAEAEALEARDWYERHHPGLGADFTRDVDRAIGMISESPRRHPPADTEPPCLGRVYDRASEAIGDRSRLRSRVNSSSF